MRGQTTVRRGRRLALTTAVTLLASGSWTAAGAAEESGDNAPEGAGPEETGPEVEGPIPGTPPGDPASDVLEETYPFFSTPYDLDRHRYVEEEYHLAGEADAYSTSGDLLEEDVPYETRIVVRRPARQHRFSGTVLMEWQNVSAGYDLDALWNPEHVIREGHAWVGVSAQRVGVDQLREWSPTRYGDLDVTGGGEHPADELSYDIYQQAARALRDPGGTDPMGGLDVEAVLGIGASQSAGRMTVYYDNVLPQVAEPTIDGYGFIVGSAPSREGDEPVMHVLSETDVRTPVRREDSDRYRRWEVAGAAHSGWHGQVYRAPISERDLPDGAPEYECSDPPFSRVPMHHVTTRAYDHLDRWVEHGTPPPQAPYLEFDDEGNLVRDELGHAQGGIQLSQVAVPTALNTGINSGADSPLSFCVLFGTHQPFDEEQLDELYPSRGGYVSSVVRTDWANVRDGYISRTDARGNLRDAIGSDIGR